MEVCRWNSRPRRVTFPPVLNRHFIAALALLTLACGGGQKPVNPSPQDPKKEREPVHPLATTTFAGQPIAVTPLTLVVSDEATASSPPLDNRAFTLVWADSLLATALNSRAPEVKWVLPAELRKVARRAPTVAPDPDRMGQSILRGPKIEDVPDPLRTNIRSMVAMVGGRYALIPAALVFTQDTLKKSVLSEMSITLVDGRTGKVIWRTLAWAHGATPEQALVASLDLVLPVEQIK